jgi:acetyl/propionyl-CoA carboxylase alpha subunit
MKRFVNGQEVDLEPAAGVEIDRLHDRMIVKGPDGAHSAVSVRLGDTVHISYRGKTFIVEKASARRHGTSAASSGEIRAPMPGQIVDVAVMEGQSVAMGDKVLVLEAMKTQQGFSAPFAGVVRKLSALKGQQVSEGELLAVIEPTQE